MTPACNSHTFRAQRRALALFPLLAPLFADSLSGCAEANAAPRSEGASAGKHPLLGASAPLVDLSELDGGPISIAGYAGRVIMLDFWATWCKPCKESFPAYQKLRGKLGDQFVVIGVSVDDKPNDIAAFQEATGAQFAIAWDNGHIAAKAYSPPTIPTSFLIDKNGIVRFVHEGFHAGDEVQLENEVKSLLS